MYKSNNHFLEKYKNILKSRKVDIPLFSDFLSQFEKKDVDNETYKEIIKVMLDIPYYENNTLVNILRKFRILKEKLVLISAEIEDEKIIERLSKIQIPKTVPVSLKNKKDKSLIDLN